jgi:hypothetical protein
MNARGTLTIHVIIAALRRSHELLHVGRHLRYISSPDATVLAQQRVGELQTETFLVVLRLVF